MKIITALGNEEINNKLTKINELERRVVRKENAIGNKQAHISK